ncbi:MAG: DNA translocase FtsK [Planctomycetaceae bacterium]|nr:DNA translocase FtsK [Planctomycetaceae bacterium]
MLDTQRLKNDLLALALLAVVVFTALALCSYNPADPPSTLVFPPQAQATNLCGPVGSFIAHVLLNGFGLGAYFLLGALILADLAFFSRKPIKDPFVRLGGIGVLLVGICLILQIIVPHIGPAPVVGSGGYVGALGKGLLTDKFSTGGSVIIVSTLLCTGILLTTEGFFFRLAFQTVALPVRMMLWPLYGKKTAQIVNNESISSTPVAKAEIEKPKPPPVEVAPVEPKGDLRVNPPVVIRPPVTVNKNWFGFGEVATAPRVGLPPVELLEEAEEFPFELLALKAQHSASILERTFEEFGLNVKVTEVDTGPVVTQFELDLEPGLRVSKVINLQDDLAIALRVAAVRVVSPIPGKNTVGVEVPNDKRVTVRLRELLEATQEQAAKSAIPMFLGKDVSGHPLVVDMAKMPHLLIAGRTGTGKSVCLNSLIISMLMTRSPEDLRMLMIDPKMVELSPYTRIPHLMHPVITDMKKAEAVLAWAVEKMEERYDLLARVGVRHLDSYNKLGRDGVLERLGLDPDDDEAAAIPERMPYIVIVADEMADMMMTSGKDVEGHIIRLAQKSRAVGIHLILATQKPTVDVITGLIKSNLPARISFQVSSRTDSRVVLDESGAERLLGNGDMLYLAPGTSTVTRAQGAFISDEEVNEVISFFKDCEPQYSEEIEKATAAAANASSGGSTGGEGSRERDALYGQAVDIVLREGRGSVSLLQRALGVGYGRAARMVDHMAEDGIVGDYNGSKSRDVVCSFEEWEDMRERMGYEAVYN